MIHKKIDHINTIKHLKPFFDINFSIYFFFSYVRKTKKSPAKYYQKTNERIQQIPQNF